MRGIGHVLYLEDAPVIFLKRGESMRETIRTRIAGNCDRLFGSDSAPAAKALYFGNQEFIDKGTLADFKRAGVLHVLAASGLHVAVVAALPVFLLGLVRLPVKLILAVTGLVVLGYLWLTDMPVSLVRACAMFLLFGLQRILDRKGNAFNALFLSALLIMMLYPGDIFSLGFQLSYGATLGILLFHGPYRRALEGLPGPLAGPLSVSLAAQTVVVPLLLYRMNEIHLAAPLGNLAVIPLVSLFLVASIAANLLSLVTAAASWMGHAGDVIFAAARGIAGVLSGLGLHRTGGEAWKALPVVLFSMAVPLALRRFLTPPLLLALPAVAVAAWLLVPGHGEARRHATIFRHERGTLILAREGPTLTIIGTPPERRHLARVAEEAVAAQSREVVLRAHRGDFATLTGFEYLARRLPVRRCHLPGDFRIREYTGRFFSLLEGDRAELVLEGIEGASPECGMTDSSTWAGRLYGAISGSGTPGRGFGPVAESGEIRHVTLR
jgi:ComEC/Rec2-related protein